MDIYLKQTCQACPQQYDAYLEDKIVGYLRLRHGRFTVHCPDPRGTLVYSAAPKGDGIFDEDEEEFYLNVARSCIETWVATQEIKN